MLDSISSDLETQVMRKEKRKEQAAHGVPRFGPLPVGLSPQDGWENVPITQEDLVELRPCLPKAEVSFLGQSALDACLFLLI